MKIKEFIKNTEREIAEADKIGRSNPEKAIEKLSIHREQISNLLDRFIPEEIAAAERQSYE